MSYFVRAKVPKSEDSYTNSVASNSSALKVPVYKAGMFKDRVRGDKGKKKEVKSDQHNDNDNSNSNKRKAETTTTTNSKKTKWTEDTKTDGQKPSVQKPPATKMSKKAAKKNAYKAKQREQKLARLNKKKADVAVKK